MTASRWDDPEYEFDLGIYQGACVLPARARVASCYEPDGLDYDGTAWMQHGLQVWLPDGKSGGRTIGIVEE